MPAVPRMSSTRSVTAGSGPLSNVSVTSMLVHYAISRKGSGAQGGLGRTHQEKSGALPVPGARPYSELQGGGRGRRAPARASAFSARPRDQGQPGFAAA